MAIAPPIRRPAAAPAIRPAWKSPPVPRATVKIMLTNRVNAYIPANVPNTIRTAFITAFSPYTNHISEAQYNTNFFVSHPLPQGNRT